MSWLELTEKEAYNECAQTLKFTLDLTDDLQDLKEYLQAMVNDIELWQKHNKGE